MPLSPRDVVALSQLVDAAAALTPLAREAWLQARPAALQPLVPQARAMLEALHAQDLDTPSLDLPALPALPGDAPQPQPGERIGPFRLVELIGQGGMGQVWRAERADGLYEREVALKLPDPARGSALAGRMARERRIGARLEHPHIARLYDAGVDDAGRPYLVLEWVRGLDLVAHAERHRLNRAQRLALLMQACAALAHAHARLVVHRDIKPSNILVDEAGQLKLLDFGIARLLLPDDEATTGLSSGHPARGTHTPGYAAPEQAAGGEVTTATDLYSLGVVAHRLLLGRLPDRPGTLDDAARRALGPDLAAVLARAMHAEPAQRYSSADRFADDLRRVAEGRPALAAQASWVRRLGLFARRQRRPLAAAGAGLAALALAAVMVLQHRALEQAQTERLALAREFLLDVLEDAEPMEHQAGTPITAQQMIDSALRRAREGFVGQQALRGTVLVQVGLMMRRLQQPEQALQVLEQAHQLLRESAEPDDPSLHIAAAQLALQQLELERPDQAGALRLAEGALAGCRADSERCARARLYARTALRTVALRQGDEAGALAHAQAELVESERAFGPDHAETALTRLNLAQVLRNSGELLPARAALVRAEEAAARTTLRAADRLQLAVWSVVVDSDLGRHDAVLQRAGELLEQPGAREEVPLLHRLRAQSLYEQGRFGAARQAAEAAVAAAGAAGDALHETMARLALARVLALQGEHRAARRATEQVLAELQAQGYDDRSFVRLRARRTAGEVALRAGDDATARAWLTALPALHERGAGRAPAAPVELAQALDLLGVLERRAGQPELARTHHVRAGELLAAALPEAHPLRLRHALLAASDDARAVAVPLAQYLESLPADSGWRAWFEPLARGDAPAAGGVW